MLELFAIVLLLILCNAFFALSEMSVVTSRKPRLKQLRGKGADKALELAENPERFLSTVQVGISLLTILTGMLGGDALSAMIGAQLAEAVPALGDYAKTAGDVLAVGAITFVSIVLGELLPKRLALLAPERLAAFVSLPMHWLSVIATPAVWLLSVSTRGFLKLLRLENAGEAQVTEEEIRLLVSESHEQGVIDDDERNMVNRVLRLGDRTADSLMTPRTRIAWLDVAAPYEENLKAMREARFSRFPVYRGNDSDVVGVLEVKSLLDNLGEAVPDLFGELRETLFVSESTHAMKLLEIFREEQQSLALVVDEYGEIQGLVTVSDLMGAMVGRLQATENTADDALVVTRDDGSLLVDGSLPNDDLRELLGGVALPGDEDDYNTLAGMVIEHFGRIPQVGEHFDWAGWRIEVVDLDGARIDKLLLQKLPEHDDADAD
ncbi:hemolysin family protein [Pseudoxanthomonas sangjuensis]|uniref:hemolysin family protein n=1 Tax=Pseudoxanthomonas sangjuensis TaxID=1503750 RepID=UPI001390A733|nr:hemolysin family protein [Pseudoxanthomonas sangjuensis]KAF1713379.1 hemolysin [Pseudoxanthomonas sangjuensis]